MKESRTVTTTKNTESTIHMKYEDRIQRAIDLFMSGYGCCQSVVAAFADLYDLDNDQALRIAAGFGGGVGRMRMMCGAVSGLVILAGLSEGQTKGDDREGKAHCYQVVQELLARSEAENGSLICAELLGLKGPVPRGNFMPDERNAEYYKKRPCAAKVESAARIFAHWLAEQENLLAEQENLPAEQEKNS